MLQQITPFLQWNNQTALPALQTVSVPLPNPFTDPGRVIAVPLNTVGVDATHVSVSSIGNFVTKIDFTKNADGTWSGVLKLTSLVNFDQVATAWVIEYTW